MVPQPATRAGGMKNKKYDDFEGMFHFQRKMQQLIHDDEDFMARAAVGWLPLADIFETEGAYIILLEVPGVQRNAIEVEADGRDLRVRGVKKQLTASTCLNFHQMEREYGEFRRVFRFDVMVDPTGVEASLKGGVLSIRVAKDKRNIPVDVPAE
jgi:HSP20 family molecular chaperone IbpA